MAPRPIIIDTDPGQDDAAAILLALASPELELLGLCTVAGNVPLPLTTKNALMLLELAGRTDLGVYAGCMRPLVRDLVTAEHAHGRTGLDGCGLPDPTTQAQPEHAVDWLIRTLLAAPEPVTLVPIGPLTNIAMALVKAPQIAPKVRELVLMGGAWRSGGNITPAAEFNFYVDPHAAHVVFTSGLPIVMFPLDATHQALVTPERLEAVRRIDTAVGRAMTGMLTFYDRTNVDRHGQPGSPLHDPLTVAWLLKPDLFGTRRVQVRMETAGEVALGASVVDAWGAGAQTPNATLVERVNAEGFFTLFTERLATL